MGRIQLRGCLAAVVLLSVAVGCGTAASPTLDCVAPMDPASASLAGTSPAWITFDRSSLGPRNTTSASAEPTGILIVVGDEVPSLLFYVIDAHGRRLAIDPRSGAGPADELTLRQDEAQLDRGSAWLTRVAVRFAEPGCYYGVFEGLQAGPRKVQIRVDP